MRLEDPAFPHLYLSDDAGDLDLDRVHSWLTTAYWCKGIPRAILEKAVHGSLVFGVFAPEGQVGFARVVTDRATFAWVCDVFVDPAWRGRGLGKWLMSAIKSHPDLQGLRRMLLATVDAHGLYEQFGFVRTTTPDRWMEVLDREVYQRAARNERGA